MSADELPDEPLFDAEAEPLQRRPSTSTVASRRQSYYDTQRINRRSRPASVASQPAEQPFTERRSRPVSQATEPMDRRSRPTSVASRATSKSRAKRFSSGQQYQMPEAFQQLDEVALPQPLPPRDERAHLEQTRLSTPARNFSQRDPQRPNTGARDARDLQEQNLSEAAALPPVPQSRFTTSHAGGASREDASQAPHESDESVGPYRPRTAEELKRDSLPPASPFLTQLYTLSYLAFFSILGTLARLGVQWLTFYPGAPIVTPVIWANFGGSLIMGFLAEDQALFRESARALFASRHPEKWEDFDDHAELSKHKKTIPLYIGLAVGFCGSFTSFSSWSRDIFLALSNNLPTPVNHPAGSPLAPSSTVGRNGGYSFEALVAVILTTLALSLGGLIAGAHLALSLQKWTPSIPRVLTRRVLDPLMILLGLGCWLGAVFLAIWPPDRPRGPSSRGAWSNETWRGEVIFALVFAPVGCILRFYASLKLNGLVAAFPLGTFAVNMFGTAVEGMCYDIQHVGVGIMGRLGGGRVGCQILQGVMDGFCGCLTTVSTFAAEVNGLKRKHAYTYAFVSVLSGLCLMVVIMGSVRWTVGFGTPACNTGYPNKVHG